MPQIPILNLTRQYDQLKDRINEALIRVAASGHYILGPEVKAFEEEMAQYLSVKHVIGCANGTDALYLALRALKLNNGDEVITTPFSFIATSESIVRAGGRPVFVDIEPDTMNMDVRQLKKALTSKTRGILPVHIFGQPANMDEIQAFARKHNLFVIEDCAQSIGSEYKGRKTGTIGDIGCFSFFPSKNLGAMGDGGMCTTNDDELAERLRMLRVHGSRKRYYHEEPGINSRLDEMQAAVLRVKLQHLDEWNQARRGVARRYTELLAPLADFVTPPAVREDVTHVFHQYTLRLKASTDLRENARMREKVQQELGDAGVQAMIYYPVPLYLQETHGELKYNAADYPVCEEVSAQVLSLPMFPELTADEQTTVIQALTRILTQHPATV